jgi:outer membrane protein insertion porin family
MSSIGQAITYDKRDNRQDPTEGYYIRFSTDFAGLGGDEQFIRTELSGIYYYSFLSDWVFSVGARSGYNYNLSDDPLRLSNRYFIGSDGFRGFARGGVGPRDKATNDSLGGNKFYVGTMEVAVPLGVGREFGLKGILFTDVGSVWGVEDNPAGGPGINDSSSPRVTVGAGAAFKTPFGPVRIDLGYAVVKETFDDTEFFTFNFGSRF